MKKIIKIIAITIFLNNCSNIFNSKSLIDLKSKNMICKNCNGSKKLKCPRCKGGKKLHEITLKGKKLIDCERCKGTGYSKCRLCEEVTIEEAIIESIITEKEREIVIIKKANNKR